MVTFNAVTRKPKHWSVYALKDPDTQQVRYVGWTSNDVGLRLRRHRYSCLRKNKDGSWYLKHHQANWVRKLCIEDKWPPILEVLETGTDPTFEIAERRWIAFYKQQGCDLTNATDGGEGWGLDHAALSKRSKQLLLDNPESAARSFAAMIEGVKRMWADPVKRILLAKKMADARAVFKTIVSDEDVRALREQLRIWKMEGTKKPHGFITQTATKYGVCRRTISEILAGKTRKAAGGLD